jgi:hypothetical protein
MERLDGVSRDSGKNIAEPTNTAVPDWAFSLRLWCIMAWRRRPLSGGALFSMPPTARIPNASSASLLNPCPHRRRSGSTNHNQLQGKNSVNYASSVLSDKFD